MNTQISTAKLGVITELCHFALDVNEPFIAKAHPDIHVEVAQFARVVVEQVFRTGTDSLAKLAQAQATPTIAAWLNQSYFGAHPLTNTLYVAEITVTNGWRDGLGAPLPDLSDGVAERLDALQDDLNALFVQMEDSAEVASSKKLSDWDLHTMAAFDAEFTSLAPTDVLADYVVGEAFRTGFLDLGLSQPDLANLNTAFVAALARTQNPVAERFDLAEIRAL